MHGHRSTCCYFHACLLGRNNVSRRGETISIELINFKNHSINYSLSDYYFFIGLFPFNRNNLAINLANLYLIARSENVSRSSYNISKLLIVIIIPRIYLFFS